MDRKYFSYKLKDILNEYEMALNDGEKLKEIAHELSYRKTDKAKSLRVKVIDAIDGISNGEKAANYKVKVKINKSKLGKVENDNGVLIQEDIISNIEFKRISDKDSYCHKGFRDIGHIPDVPTKRIFTHKEDIKLDFKEDDTTVTIYKRVLEELIKEIKSDNSTGQKVIVRNGTQIVTPGQEHSYIFEFDGEADIFEGAGVTTYVDNTRTDGKVVSVEINRLAVAFTKGFGNFIEHCTLLIDNTAFLEALKDRYKDVEESGCKDFNVQMAEDVLKNLGEDMPIDFSHEYLSNDLNVKQKEAVMKGLANSVFYLWGPPGTGKTFTIGSFINRSFDIGKRILIVSNTNQAVDQVILKLCEELTLNHEAIRNGRILRIGKISLTKLEEKWGKHVSIDSIVEKKSEEYSAKKEEINRQSFNLKVDMKQDYDIIANFIALDECSKTYKNLQDEIKGLDFKIQESVGIENKYKTKLNKIKLELSLFHSASVLRRLFMRKEEVILKQIEEYTISSENNKKLLDSREILIKNNKLKLISMHDKIKKQAIVIHGLDRLFIEKRCNQSRQEQEKLDLEIKKINKMLEEIKAHILMSAQVVGATITKVFLSPNSFRGYDCVLIDEASMIPLPALYYVSGLAKEKVFISGDDRQLPPIIQSNQKAILNLIGEDILTRVKKNVVEKTKRLVMLDTQYRMRDRICSLIRDNYGELYTSESNNSIVARLKFGNLEICDDLIVIDTSELYPYVSRDQFGSRYNLINAILDCRLCEKLKNEGINDIGVCTPYAAQSKLLKKAVGDMAEAGTIHRYQGDQVETMIIDIPDSLGERRVGMFLEGDIIDPNNPVNIDIGTKLFNVAISRAKDQLILVCNLKYLDSKLPQKAYLRKVLYHIYSKGTVIDARKMFSLVEFANAYEKITGHISIEGIKATDGLYNERQFEMGIIADINTAKSAILIFSGFITQERVGKFEQIFRKKISEGVKIRCITRPPGKNGSISLSDTRDALDSLERMGCVVDTRSSIHEKAVIIDTETTWVGSLNPLSFNGSTNEMMIRVKDSKIAEQILIFLSICGEKKGLDPLKGENPRCPECNFRVSYSEGKFGPFWSCECCDWKQSVNKYRKINN